MILTLCFAVSMVLVNMNPSLPTDTATTEKTIVELERKFNDTIKARDVEGARAMQTPEYRLLVRVAGRPLLEMPQKLWLDTLKRYVIESYSIDDMKVRVLGDVCVATLAYRQKAHIEGDSRDINGEFMVTDIWVRTADGWKISERHSSRAEGSAPAQK